MVMQHPRQFGFWTAPSSFDQKSPHFLCYLMFSCFHVYKQLFLVLNISGFDRYAVYSCQILWLYDHQTNIIIIELYLCTGTSSTGPKARLLPWTKTRLAFLFRASMLLLTCTIENCKMRIYVLDSLKWNIETWSSLLHHHQRHLVQDDGRHTHHQGGVHLEVALLTTLPRWLKGRMVPW